MTKKIVYITFLGLAIAGCAPGAQRDKKDTMQAVQTANAGSASSGYGAGK